MMHHTRHAIMILLLSAATTVLALDTAFARGGGSNLLMSPGYQRALKESRERRAEQPYTQPPAAYPGKKWKKRGRQY